MSAPGPAMVEAVPGAALRPYVSRLCAYREEPRTPETRAEAALPGAVLVLGFGAPLEVEGRPLTAFAGGLADRYTLTRVSGPGEGVEVVLTPFGARRLYGLPMRHLTNQVVPAEDVLGAWAGTAAERLAATPTPRDRLALAERLLRERLSAGPDPRPEVAWAWERLLGTGGGVSVSALAATLGWSHRHLVSRFHEEVGLAPKAAARVIRFARAVRLLRGGAPIARVAAHCGFYDQAHMNREFRVLGGTTPGQIRPRPEGPAQAML
ncbi:helix-turn-helix domain-containing protein [Nonomuraea pusilla]|uniref:Helix-turn-helix domain-containing protein n=1 Tax=Nonomuraea pusilla TaxID=46177 RepID=A0A1H8GT54_9ACTN|nr:AraC family transcriptional regulator [Nonomuraea pusilla]SEN47222.1 Helix-turn-helix domain-containing protein [Nonomuraea pusilla]